MKNDERAALFETRDITLGNQKDIGYIREELKKQATVDVKLDERLKKTERRTDVLSFGMSGIYAGGLLFIKTILNKVFGWF